MSELKEVEKSIQECERKISKIQQELISYGRRRQELEKTISEFEPKMKELREKRQFLLAQGEDVRQVSEEINRLKERHELEEDELVGVNLRIQNLKSEMERLQRELENLNFERIVLLSKPLIDRYNLLASELASILSELCKNAKVNRHDSQAFFSNSVFKASNSHVVIPKLFLTRENPHDIYEGDFFRL